MQAGERQWKGRAVSRFYGSLLFAGIRYLAVFLRIVFAVNGMCQAGVVVPGGSSAGEF